MSKKGLFGDGGRMHILRSILGIRSVCCGLLVVLLLMSVSIQGKAQSTSSAVKQLIYAPIAGIGEFDRSEILVVNRMAVATPVLITVFSQEGKQYDPTKITLSSNETRRLDIRNLLPSEVQKETIGGISIEFTAQVMGVSAQITISGFHGFGSIDVPVFPDMLYKSNQEDAVWWEPKGSHSFLILGNSSADPVHAEVEVASGAHFSVDLPPHATDIQAIHEKKGKRIESNLNWVHVVGSGKTGALRVTGYTGSVSTGFLSTLRFYDPQTSSDSSVYANGLHFSDSENHLVVRNLTLNPIRVSGLIYLVEGASLSPNISDQQIPAGTAIEMDLPGGDMHSLDGAAVKLTSSGGRGSIVANYVSHGRNSQITHSMPFKDIGDYGISTGGYPWRIDGTYRSKVYITNVGEVRAAIGGSIRAETGPDYFIDTRYLEIGETAIFDIRRIRDEEIPDSKGAKLSKKAMQGQFDWTTIFGDGSQRLIGRNEITDGTLGVSASFSCGGICNCPYSTLSAFVAPSSPIVVVNGTTNLVATGVSTPTCGSGNPSNFTISPAPWSISVPGHFTLSSGQPSSTMTGVNGGSSGFYTPFTGTNYAWNGQSGQCILNGQPLLNPGGTGTSAPSFAITLIPLDNFAGRSTINYGLEEVINLSFMTNPAGASAASLGGLNWTLVSGGGVLVAANPNGTATYTAPANAATVVLKLAIAAGAQQGTNHTVTLLIVPPQGHLETVSNIFHTQGFLSIGFMARVDLTPTYVSFNRLQFQEGAVAAITTGYFVGRAPDHTLGRLLPILSCNLTNGCSPGIDTASIDGYPSPFAAGDWLWPIPWKYQNTSGTFTTFITANQHMTSAASGLATIQKAGAGPYSKLATDPSSTY